MIVYHIFSIEGQIRDCEDPVRQSGLQQGERSVEKLSTGRKNEKWDRCKKWELFACVHTASPQAFSELQLQNAELRRRLEDADLCKNNCNTSTSLPTPAVEEKQGVNNNNMSLPPFYPGGDPLKLDLEEVKLDTLDGGSKMIPEVIDSTKVYIWHPLFISLLLPG